ncbi:MAG: GNAT family N-acetyltransferase [Bacteroidota bacterium]
MKVVKLKTSSPVYLRNAMMEMAFEFQEILNEGPNELKIANGLESILRENSPGHAFVLCTDDGEPAGMVYCNIGCGLQSGGPYLWINGIYVRKPHQGEGTGKFFLDYILEWGKSKGCIYAIASRHTENAASKMLFQKGGFDQELSIIMDRRLD